MKLVYVVVIRKGNNFQAVFQSKKAAETYCSNYGMNDDYYSVNGFSFLRIKQEVLR